MEAKKLTKNYIQSIYKNIDDLIEYIETDSKDVKKLLDFKKLQDDFNVFIIIHYITNILDYESSKKYIIYKYPCFDFKMDKTIISEFDNIDVYKTFIKIVDDESKTETLDIIIKYLIYTQNWVILLKIMNNCKNNLFKYFLIYYPENILLKILNDYNIDINIIILYYINNKINNTKYIPFEYFPINNNKIIYTILLLINDGYLKTNDNNLLKILEIFNKLPYDMKLKICNISNININEIKLCSNYIFFNI